MLVFSQDIYLAFDLYFLHVIPIFRYAILFGLYLFICNYDIKLLYLFYFLFLILISS